MKTEKCGECKGTGYWANYPPPSDYVLDMNDCCGVCNGHGKLTTSTQACPKCGSVEPHSWEAFPYEKGALWCNECDYSFPYDDKNEPRCRARESGGVQCELPRGHSGGHACPEALGRAAAKGGPNG